MKMIQTQSFHLLLLGGGVNYCPGEFILKLVTRIGEWHQNLSGQTADPKLTYPLHFQSFCPSLKINYLQ